MALSIVTSYSIEASLYTIGLYPGWEIKVKYYNGVKPVFLMVKTKVLISGLQAYYRCYLQRSVS